MYNDNVKQLTIWHAIHDMVNTLRAFCRWHFQMLLLEWELLHFNPKFTRSLSLWVQLATISTGSGNGLAQVRRQAFDGNNDVPLRWCIYASQRQSPNVFTHWRWVEHIYPPVNYTSLVQIMACRLVGAKALSEPMLEYCQFEPYEQTSVKCWSKFMHFHSRKYILKCHLRNGVHCISVSTY